jgi:hypothetical protein
VFFLWVRGFLRLVRIRNCRYFTQLPLPPCFSGDFVTCQKIGNLEELTTHHGYRDDGSDSERDTDPTGSCGTHQ